MQGCCFADRCFAHLGENCDREKPALLEVETGHFVACHMVNPG